MAVRISKQNKVQAGRLLTDNGSIQVYELDTDASSYFGVSVAYFEQVTVAFSSTHVAVRTSQGALGETPAMYQVVLSREVFESLLASYRAFERAEKKRPAPAPDDFDPFLDPDLDGLP